MKRKPLMSAARAPMRAACATAPATMRRPQTRHSRMPAAIEGRVSCTTGPGSNRARQCKTSSWRALSNDQEFRRAKNV